MSDELKDVKSSLADLKKRKPRAGMSIKSIDLDKVHKRLLNVLARETNHLLAASHKEKLDKEGSQALTGYLKLIRELKSLEEDEAKHLSDEELAKIAAIKEEPDEE